MSSVDDRARAAMSPRVALSEARGLAQRRGLQIKNGPPAIDQTHWIMYLPEDLPDRVPNPDLVDTFVCMFRAWTMHEAGGHGRYTTPTLLKDHEDELRQTPLLKSIWNALEDAFVERSVMTEFRGARPVLDAGRQAMEEQGFVRNGDRGAEDLLVTYLCLWTRVHWVDQPFLREKVERLEPKLRELLGADPVAQIHDLLVQARNNVACSEDTMAYARQILDVIQDAAEDPPATSDSAAEAGEGGSDDSAHGDEEADTANKADSEDGDNTSETAAAADDDDASGDGEPDSASDADSGKGDDDDDRSRSSPAGDCDSGAQEGDPETGGQQQASTGDDGAPDAGDDSDGRTHPSINPDGAQQVLNDGQSPLPDDFEQLAEQIRQLTQEVERQGYGTQGGPGSGGDAGIKPVVSDSRQLERFSARVGDALGELRATLYPLIRSREINRRARGPSGYKLDPRRLTRIRTGDPNYWRTRRRRPQGTASVLLLLDLSGSMGAVIHDVSLVGLAFGEALTDLEVRHAVCGFGSSLGMNRGDIVRVKGFDEGREVHERYGGLPAAHGGGTPLGGALQVLIPYLQAQRTDRQVLITVTDGMPHDLHDTVRHVQAAQAAGVETTAIGIGVDPTQLGMQSVCVKGIDELAARLFAIAYQFAA